MALNIPWELFRKLFSNSISEIERQQLLAWSQQSELNQHIYHEILDDTQIRHFLLSESSLNESREWEKILSRIQPPAPEMRISKRTFYWSAGIAATLLLLLGLSAGFYFFKQKNRQNPDDFTYVYSPRGQRTQMVLPDKTKVWLNSETSIRYSVGYNQKIREVYIEGEAFFQVAKNPEKPFLVNTSDIKIKVYGTSFNVKAYPKEKIIETTLIEGKLSVIPTKSKEEGQEIYLKPKERLTYTKVNSKVEQAIEKPIEAKVEHAEPIQKAKMAKVVLSKNVDAEIEQSWKDGKLLFKDELFSDLAIKLERWYDIKIHFNDERIKLYRFTGKFDKETINEAMEALRASSQESYRYNIVFRDIYLGSK